VRVLSRLYRRLFLARLMAAFDRDALRFFGDLAPLAEPAAFTEYLRPLRRIEWVVYSKRPFDNPQHVLDYLGRYTHRVAIANSRLVELDDGQVRFRWKDYRHPEQRKVMTLAAHEFIRRFLLHVVPDGFRRIRHFGFLANAHRNAKLATIRTALDVPAPVARVKPVDYRERVALLTGRSLDICPCCGGHMVDIATLPREPTPLSPIWCDSS
jgi:Putative transposase